MLARGAAAAIEADPVLSFSGISKSFGATLAIDNVSFALEAGEIHALVGENGAGKSTLIRVLAGDHQPDAGEIRIGGDIVRFADPSSALRQGVGFVHQIPGFVLNLSVTENLLLGNAFTHRRLGLIDWSAEHRAARRDLESVGLTVDPRVAVETLLPHERQLVAVARAMKRGVRVLVLDEVTASLSEPEVRILHAHIRALKDRGIAILYVSHRLEEIFRLADRVTVMRDGRHVATLPVPGLTQGDLIDLIVGAQGKERRHDGASQNGLSAASGAAPILSVRDFGDDKLKNLSFDLAPGEVLGIAGLGGSGRSRLLRMLYGLQSHTTGEMALAGEAVRFKNASEALAAGLGLLTEDRIADGFVSAMPIWQNITLPWAARFSRHGLLKPRQERASAAENAARMGVKMASVGGSMAQLSGGNQQKAIFARWTLGAPRVLLLDEPTHGVDVRSKGQIYGIIRQLAAQGVAAIVVTSELEEFEALCDRVLLLRGGRIVTELRRGHMSKEAILHQLLLGDTPGASP
jgi:ABC-type sugar transport system ATPase subunit